MRQRWQRRGDVILGKGEAHDTASIRGGVPRVGALLFGGAAAPASAQEGAAQARVVHASPDAPAVDVAVAGGPVLFSNVAFSGRRCIRCRTRVLARILL